MYEIIEKGDREAAIVTGAARGIGFAIARKLASRGINVLLADVLEKEGLASAMALQKEFGVEASFLKTDITKEADIKNMVETVVQKWGRLDWAANNAGRGQNLDDNEDSVTAAEFDSLYELNQRGVWLCQKYEAEQMRKQEPRVANGTASSMGGTPQRGAIVNTASICGHVAVGQPCYTATKHAVIGITKIGGMFYGKYGIRCNSISPAAVLTEGYAEFKEAFANDERFREQAVGWSNRVPLGRPSKCEEQANVASFLLSGESSYVNCADILVDGGLTSVADK